MNMLVSGLGCSIPWIDLHLAVSFLDGRTTLSYGHVTAGECREYPCREYPQIRSRDWIVRVTSGGMPYYAQHLSLSISGAQAEAHVDLSCHRPWAGRLTAHQSVLLASRLRGQRIRAQSPDRIRWITVTDARIERA